MPIQLYPYRQLSLTNIKGEKWKHLPGLEGYYMLSNFGRVKRLEYEMQYRNGAVYTKQEKIIKPYLISHRNKLKKDLTYYLCNRVTVEGSRHHLMIGRIVYYCFVKKFDLKNKNINILYKDGNGLNMHPGNLLLSSLSQKGKRAYAKGRMESPFKKLSSAKKQERQQSIRETLSKQVSQYALSGKIVKTFSSASAAQNTTGVYATSIGKVASGNGITAGGFSWAWGKAPRIDLELIREINKIEHRKKHGQPVTQYDFKGKKIAQYPSIQDAAAATGANANAIRLVIKHEYKSAKGFYWQKGYGKNSIDLSKHTFGKASMSITQSKKVKQFTLRGKLLKVFPSIKAAAASIWVSPSAIVDCCRGRQQSTRRYKWKYA